jgi:hypothetical protein
MQEVSGSIPLTSTKFVELLDIFDSEKVVNGVKYTLFYVASIIGLNSKVPIV